MLSGQDEIAEEVDAYYSILFASAPDRDFALNMDTLGLPVRDLSHLEAAFTHEEVEKVVKGMPLDKALGPDGFTGRFYASCWHIIRDDIMRAMDHFFPGAMRGLPSINQAIVTLLPNKM